MKPPRTALVVAVAVAAALSIVTVPANENQDAPAEEKPAAPEGTPADPAGKEPDHISVQHILIGFAGSARPTSATRTAEEARTLAYEILERAKKGEDFDALVKQYTDDRPPGVYAMANHGVEVKPPPPREFKREGMVAAFGDVGFKLAVGEIGIADFEPAKSPYGYHIIKRLE